MNRISSAIDKEQLYGRFQKSEDVESELALDVVRKALDIKKPMNIDVRKSGIGAAGIAGIVGAATLGPLALAAAMFFRQPTELPKPIEKIIEKVWDSSVEMEVEPPKE